MIEQLAEMPTYGAYKDSGVEWISEIPPHWIICNFRYLIDVLTDYTANGSFADLAKNVTYIDEPSYSRLIRLTDLRADLENDGVYVDEKSHNYLKKSELYGNELLVANVGAYAGLVCIMPKLGSPATLGPNMFLIKLNQTRVTNKYAQYLINSESYWKLIRTIAQSSAQPKLNKDNIRELKVILPLLVEQTAITAFLDRKTAQIDQAVAIKEQQIALLKEHKQILIQTAVTRGLDPNAPMRDSGVKWIGEIPAHWKIKRAKYLFKEVDERSVSGDEELLSVSHMTGVTPRSEKNVTMFMAEDYTGSKTCQKGDLVFNIMWAWMGALGVSDRTGIVSSSYGVFRQLKNISNPNYLEFLLKTTGYIEHYNKVSTGLHSSRLRFYSHMFFNMKLGFPSKDEQDEIVTHIETQSAKIELAIAIQQQQIDKLKEYKTTLINSAVTGKIHVPEVVI